ncbi:hypothetical protein EYF80_057626 [Liparis tanakae]|uniref:Uncharacterized protein n=1 Tax=Liparis tanakae TaxID=230148 RepID=A0A4Z2ETN5_9TELE|nr:hypothetical protein EYF80_057626 [Liparis tanakae]
MFGMNLQWIPISHLLPGIRLHEPIGPRAVCAPCTRTHVPRSLLLFAGGRGGSAARWRGKEQGSIEEEEETEAQQSQGRAARGKEVARSAACVHTHSERDALIDSREATERERALISHTGFVKGISVKPDQPGAKEKEALSIRPPPTPPSSSSSSSTTTGLGIWRLVFSHYTVRTNLAAPRVLDTGEWTGREVTLHFAS